MTHPRLRSALDEAHKGVGPILGIALGARAAQDEGRYCECTEPELTGSDLLCGACLLNNRGQEVLRVEAIVRAHEFEPDPRHPFFCRTCTMGADAPRHHGVSAVGRTSWGTEVRP